MAARRDKLLKALGFGVTTVAAAAIALPLLSPAAFEALVVGQMVPHLQKLSLIRHARLAGIPSIVIHVLPQDETTEADCYVRVTGGAEELIRAIHRIAGLASGSALIADPEEFQMEGG